MVPTANGEPFDPTTTSATDYRVNWARSGEGYPSWTDDTANHQPTTTSQQLTDLDEGVGYKVRVRARYHDGADADSPWSGPWAEAPRQVAAQPSLGVRSADEPPVTLEPPQLTVIEPDDPDDPLVALQQLNSTPRSRRPAGHAGAAPPSSNPMTPTTRWWRCARATDRSANPPTATCPPTPPPPAS